MLSRNQSSRRMKKFIPNLKKNKFRELDQEPDPDQGEEKDEDVISVDASWRSNLNRPVTKLVDLTVPGMNTRYTGKHNCNMSTSASFSNSDSTPTAHKA